MRSFWLGVLFVCTEALAMGPDGNYRIKLTKNTGDLDVAVQTFTGPAVTVGLENRSSKTANCRASFTGYPHAATHDETRQTTIAPGNRATLSYPARKLGGSFSTAFVEVNCTEKAASR